MRSIFLASCMLVGSLIGAQASVFRFNLANGLRLTANTDLPAETYAPFPIGGSINTLVGQRGDANDAQGQLIARSPFSGEPDRAYDAVLGGGFARFVSPLPPIEPGDPTFGYGSGSLSFVWGSPDPFNLVEFLGSGLTVTGGDLGSLANGGGSYFVTVSGLGTFYGTRFSSDQNAFEFAVSAVPLPSSALLFGGALLVFGVAGCRTTRKQAAAAV